MFDHTDEEVLAQLTAARDRGLTVSVDNDALNAYDEDADEYVLNDVHPVQALQVLLAHFGLMWENV